MAPGRKRNAGPIERDGTNTTNSLLCRRFDARPGGPHR